MKTAWHNLFNKGERYHLGDIIFTVLMVDRDVAYASDDEAAPEPIHALDVIGAQSSHLGRQSPLSTVTSIS